MIYSKIDISKVSSRNKLLCWLVLTLISLMSANFNLLLPSLLIIRDSLNCSNFMIQLALIAGPAIAIPTNIVMCFYSEYFNRKSLLLFCIICFFCGSLICGLSTNISHFLTGRIMQVIGDSGLSVIGILILSDFSSKIKTYLSYNAILLSITSILSPLLINYFINYKSWHWSFFSLAILSFILLILFIILMPKNSNINSSQNNYSFPNIKSELGLLFSIPAFNYLVLVVALCNCITSLSDAYSPFYYIELSKFSESGFSFIRISLLMIGILSSMIYIKLLKKYDSKQLLISGFKVFSTYIIFVSITFAAHYHDKPFIFYISASILAISNSFVNPTGLSLALSYAHRSKGISLSVYALARNVICSVIPFSVSLLFAGNIELVIISILAISVITSLIVIKLKTLLSTN